MSLENRCKLYFLVYQKLSMVTFSRGSAKNRILPVYIHQEALKRTNYILAAIGEKLDMDELLTAL